MTTTAASQARHIEAARLRQAGWTFRQIAEHLGYDYNSGATGHAVRNGLRLLAEMQTQEPFWMRRRFGIEIEHAGISLYRSAEALRDGGLDTVEMGYTHRVVREWKIVPDGSCGNEAVSPILKGKDGWAAVKVAMDSLRSAGARVTRQCGMHVHLDMQDMTGEQIGSFIELWADFQQDIDQFVSPSRRSHNANQWCRPLRASEVQAYASQFRMDRSAPQHADRYRSLNVTAFPKYGTLEIRQHQGSLNAKTARCWGTLIMALVEVARQGRKAELLHGSDFLSSLQAIVGLTDVQVRDLQARADRLNRVRV